MTGSFGRTARSILRLVLLGASLSVAACDEAPPTKLGFVGGLSGRVADLGKAGRDGALLAVEQFNAAGGLNGQPVQLLIRDDKQDQDAVKAAVRDLAKEGAVAIFGPMTSSMAIVAAPLATELKIPMISPTTSTNMLSGIDDYFLRLYPASSNAAETLARQAIEELHLETVGVVYDLANRAHTEGWYTAFRAAFEGHGGKVVEATTFTSGETKAFIEPVEPLVKAAPQAVFIIANALDTALICQSLQRQGFEGKLLASEWSATPDLLHHGGGAVEGIRFLHTVDTGDMGANYLKFERDFRERFRYDPSFASIHTFDAVHLVLKTLVKTPDPKTLRGAILSGGPYEGVQSTFSFDPYGDIQRTYFPMTVSNGRFETVK